LAAWKDKLKFPQNTQEVGGGRRFDLPSEALRKKEEQKPSPDRGKSIRDMTTSSFRTDGSE